MNIYEFLKTGVLGKLSLEDTEESLHQKFDKKWLGEKLFPDANYKDVYYYYADEGSIEICVQFGEVAHFNILPYGQKFYIASSQTEKCWLGDIATLEQFIQLLNSAGTSWAFYSRYCLRKQVTLITEGNVLITLMYDEQEPPYLAKLQVSSSAVFGDSSKIHS